MTGGLPTTILHTNDLHGRLTPARADAIRGLKDADDAVFFDSGDCIKAGNLAIPVRPDPAWGLLARAGCDAGAIGNRESHVMRSAFRAKLAGASHALLCANLRAKDGTHPLRATLTIEAGGIRIGLIGVMVPMVTRRMASAPASQFLWDPPIESAIRAARGLRPEVDLLVALTHIGHREDLELAERSSAEGLIDVVLGGHSHTVVPAPVRVSVGSGRPCWVCQGGSHGKYVGRYDWDGRELTGHLVPLPDI